MASGIMRRAMVFLGLDDEELDDFDAYDDAPVAPQAPRSRYAPEQVEMAPLQQSGIRALPRDQDPSGAVTVQPRPLVPRAISPIPSVKVHVVAPTRFADAQEVGDRFKSGQPVIVNLSIGNDQSLSRRMVDFISGLTYALSGSMEKVADQVFLLTPSDVEVPAEEKRRLQEKGLYRP